MIRVKKFVFNTFQENCFVLNDETGECVIIDPGCYEDIEKKELADYIRDNRLKPVININTHCHIDHILGNDFISKTYNLNPVFHRGGIPFFRTAREIALSFGYDLKLPAGTSTYVEDGEVIPFGNSKLTVLYTPGHAEGSICLYSQDQKIVITGDVLFRDTIGRTDLPSGDFNQLMASIKEKLFTLPDDTEVFCGHGPETTIGYEKMNNPFIR